MIRIKITSAENRSSTYCVGTILLLASHRMFSANKVHRARAVRIVNIRRLRIVESLKNSKFLICRRRLGFQSWPGHEDIFIAVHLKVIYRDGRELSMKLFAAICFTPPARERRLPTTVQKQKESAETHPFSL